MNPQMQVGWHELHTMIILLDSRNYSGGNAGKSKGLLTGLKAKNLKIAPTFSQESATVWSEKRKT